MDLGVVGLVIGVVSLITSIVIYFNSAKDLQREAASLRRETEKVRHYSRATITWLKEAGLIDPRVHPDTGEYLDIVGSQRRIIANVEAATEGTGDSSSVENQDK